MEATHRHFCYNVLPQQDEMLANHFIAFHNPRACDQRDASSRQHVLPIFFTISANSYEMFSWCLANMSPDAPPCTLKDRAGFGLLEWACAHKANSLLLMEVLKHYRPLVQTSTPLRVPSFLCNRTSIGFSLIDSLLWQEGWHSFVYFLKFHHIFELYLEDLEDQERTDIQKLLLCAKEPPPITLKSKHHRLFTVQDYQHARSLWKDYLYHKQWFQLLSNDLPLSLETAG